MTMQAEQLMIFCDGGIGNRINALVSGLALSRKLNLSYCIYWPENNWCQAGFSDIFENEYPVSRLSIKDLHGTLSDAVVLLHDQIAANSLGVPFHSAYSYGSIEDFSVKNPLADKKIFYYPALMPPWIPAEEVNADLKRLKFTEHIRNSVAGFLHQTLGKPFHGLHLRRTDLNVGLSDQEVMKLVRAHPDEMFFVCSDDPLSETLACANPNVRCRDKASHVAKKYQSRAWLSESVDDDGRSYYGNIFRGRESVIEGVIDLLILSHSQIVGYSGSTFQKMARTFGEVCPLVQIAKPSPLSYVSASEVRRKLDAKAISSAELISSCNGLAVQGDMPEAMALLQQACCIFDGPQYLDLLHTLSVFMLNQQQAKMAQICLKELVSLDGNRPSSLLHLAYAESLLGHHEIAFERFQQAKNHRAGLVHHNDLQLLRFMTEKLQAA